MAMRLLTRSTLALLLMTAALASALFNIAIH